jgi:DNA primase
MPLTWDEVTYDLDPRNYTIKNAVERLEQLPSDPVVQVLADKPDMLTILGNIAAAG